MKKANVINAIECCAAGTCTGCYYEGVEDCYDRACKDAIAILKANEPTKPKYTVVKIYTKKTDLSAYISGKVAALYPSDAAYKHMREHYAQEREIQLIALFRFEQGKCFCKIKCPISPLPVKGEFEAATTGALDRFLKANGWNFKQKFYPYMFE